MTVLMNLLLCNYNQGQNAFTNGSQSSSMIYIYSKDVKTLIPTCHGQQLKNMIPLNM